MGEIITRWVGADEETRWVDQRVESEKQQAQNKLTEAYRNEIDSGIASQAEGLMQMAMEHGAGVFKAWLDGERLKSLTEKVEKGEALTANEAEDFKRLQAADYQVLSKKEKSGEELTGEEKGRLKGYRDRIQAEQAVRVQDCHDLTDKKVKGEALSAEEKERYEGYLNDPEMRKLRRQMEVDLRALDAAAEEAGKKPDPVGGWTLPAVASGNAPA